MPQRKIDTPDKQLEQLESLAERLSPRKLSSWDIILVVVVAILCLSIGLSFDRFFGQLKVAPILAPAPSPAVKADKPAFVLLGRHANSVYYFSEPNGQVLLYDPKSGKSESVFNLSAYQAHLWSPSGNKIAVISNQDNESGDLYVIDLSSHVQEPVLLTQRKEDAIPKSFSLLASSPMAWSPDESTIAFVAYGPNDRSEVFIAKVDGSRTWPITTNQHDLSSIVWVDDSTVAFVGLLDGQYGKFMARTDSSPPQEWR
jgi:Tol biopolymer transport system component